MNKLNSKNSITAGTFLFLFSLTLSSLVASPPSTEQVDIEAGNLRRSGTVSLQVTCRPEVYEDFQTALALLHSFFYDEARIRFEEIAQKDPECAMAWWGIAMTWYHPLWAPPTPDENMKGLEAARRAKEIGGRSELEKGLIEAIGGFFGDILKPDTVCPCPPGVDFSCHGPRTHTARAWAFSEALRALNHRYPQNTEIATFYALSMLGTSSPRDATRARQREAGSLLERLFITHPNHPGIAHYIIHAYDYPELASKALPASRRYDDIAPWVPHALHMPSHIYTRLGMWRDSIASNVASTLAARDYAAKRYDGGTTMDDLHAMDYLAFAYLQTGQDEKAKGVLQHLGTIQRIVPGNGFASAYAACAIPARYALERGAWDEATRLEMPFPEFTKAYPFAQAHIEFARAVGAARSDETELARAAIERLEHLKESIDDPKFQWWRDQVEIQRLAASAWLAQSTGAWAEATRLLSEAVAIEESVGTHPVTPGQLLPAREQLGEIALLQSKPGAALMEFEAALKAFPHRFRSHLGAARCARLLGQEALAEKHESALRELAGSRSRQDANVDLERLLTLNVLHLVSR